MKNISFILNGKKVTAKEGETIWQVAKRNGNNIPHLCYEPKPGYRPDGNCRACMVEIEGERTLVASCIRKPAEGMKVNTNSTRAKTSQKLVFELLVADQPKRSVARDKNSQFWQWASKLGVNNSRFPKKEYLPKPDVSHSAMEVNLDACIHCNLCVRACREVQVNDVIGMANRGSEAKIVFDFDDPMGDSTCVACGECVQACPTGALMPASVMNEKHISDTKVDKEVESVCPYCGVGCQVNYNIKDDKIAWVDGKDGPSNHSKLCVKGRFGYDYTVNPDRLKEPLIRKENVKKDPNIIFDPKNPLKYFRKASWKEALDFAAKGLNKTRDQYGGKSLAGFGSAKGSNEEAYLFQKLVRTGFQTNNVDHCTRLCHASSVAALLETLGSGAVSNPFYDCENSEVVIVIGANPTENHPVAATFFKNAAKRGSKLIVIDPRKSSLNKYAYESLNFRPGTDVALLNSIMNVIVKEKLYDQQYIKGYTEGFKDLEKNIKDFPPEKMEKVTGVKVETIKKVARTYAKAKSAIIFWGMGISQHVHGTDNARSLIALSLMCGQIGRPGTGLHPLRGQNNVQGASDAGLIPMVFPDYFPVSDDKNRKKLEKLWKSNLDPEPGQTVVEIMHGMVDGSIKAMYIMGENPAMSDPDTKEARKGLANLEHLVVQDLFLTETATFADVILPSSAAPEKDGSFTNTNRQVQMGRKAIPLPGNAKQDLWIINELGKRLGLDWNYKHPRDVFPEMAETMPSIKGLTWDRLDKENSVVYPVKDVNKPGEEVIFSNGFDTKNKRGKIVPTELTPPDEVPDKNFPMILMTGRLLEHWHTGSMTRRSKVLNNIEPVATAHFNPKQLKQQGISAGDKVKIETRRGKVEVKVRLDRNVPNNVIFFPFAFREAPANVLTNPKLDPFGKIPEFKYCAAKMEKLNKPSSITYK